MHYKGNLHRKSLPEYEMRFSFLFYELAGFRVQSYVHKHTQTHTCLITCKYWHLKVSSRSLLQNRNASWEKPDNLLFDPTSIPHSPQPKHTTIAAGKLKPGRFYEDVRTFYHHDVDDTYNCDLWFYGHAQTLVSDTVSDTPYQQIKRAHYHSGPVSNPGNNLWKLSDTHCMEKGHLNSNTHTHTYTHIYSTINRQTGNLSTVIYIIFSRGFICGSNWNQQTI